MSVETAESIFRSAVAQAILRFVGDDSLKTVENFLFYLDLEVNERERNLVKCGDSGRAQQLNELFGKFRTHLKLECLLDS